MHSYSINQHTNSLKETDHFSFLWKTLVRIFKVANKDRHFIYIHSNSSSGLFDYHFQLQYLNFLQILIFHFQDHFYQRKEDASEMKTNFVHKYNNTNSFTRSRFGERIWILTFSNRDGCSRRLAGCSCDSHKLWGALTICELPILNKEMSI